MILVTNKDGSTTALNVDRIERIELNNISQGHESNIYLVDGRRLVVEETPEGGHFVWIKMSMTAPGCGMGDILKEDARARVKTVPGVTDVDVELVGDPPWDQSRMSEAAKLQLGMY